jgi:hypothetical protein
MPRFKNQWTFILEVYPSLRFAGPKSSYRPPERLCDTALVICPLTTGTSKWPANKRPIVALGRQLLRVAGKSRLGTTGAPIPSTKWTVAVGLGFRRCFLEGSLRCRSLILALLTTPTTIVRCNAKTKRKMRGF